MLSLPIIIIMHQSYLHMYYLWSLLKAFCVVQTAAADAPAVPFSDVYL